LRRFEDNKEVNSQFLKDNENFIVDKYDNVGKETTLLSLKVKKKDRRRSEV